MTRGSITLFRWRGVPVRVHFTLPLVAVMIGGLRFAPGAWLGWLLVVTLHEMGHAFWALHYRMDVREIVLHGAGGHCLYVGLPSPRQKSVVAWGGVMAQAILFVVMTPIAALVPAPSEHVADLYRVLTTYNLYVALFNLIPLPWLDGYDAWKLVPMLLRREPEVRQKEVARARAGLAPRTLGEAMGPVDAGAVRDTVRRALEEARRDSRDGGDPGSRRR
jgi:Zn-dependent protease